MNFPISSSRAMLLTIAIGVMALADAPVSARAPSAVTKAQSTATIFVTVPTKVKPVTYVLDGRIWTARTHHGVGETIVLPAKATNISLTAGAIITTSVPSADGGEPIKTDYTVNRPITLESLTAKAILDIRQYITPGAVVIVPVTAKEAAKNEQKDTTPTLVAPKYSRAPDCESIYASVKRFVKAHPEKVLEVVALQVGRNETCACEVVKAAIVASAADKELVVEIVETAIEAAPSKIRIIGQCAIAVAPDALAEVQAVVSVYDSVSGDSGLSAKGGEKGDQKGGEKGDGKGGAGGDLGDQGAPFEQPQTSQHPSAEINELADIVDRLSQTTVNPFNVLQDVVTDSNTRFVGSTDVRVPNPRRNGRVVLGVPGNDYFDPLGPPDALGGPGGSSSQQIDGGQYADNNGGAGGDTEKGGFDDGGDGHDEKSASMIATVLGEVKYPGEIRFSANGKIDIITAIAMAGGYSDEADENECILHRRNTHSREAIRVDLRDIRNRKKPMVYVYEGDKVTVKKVRF